MSATLGFDVYGTLIDTQGVLSSLENMIPDKAKSFSQTWREKQLEYSFRGGGALCDSTPSDNPLDPTSLLLQIRGF